MNASGTRFRIFSRWGLLIVALLLGLAVIGSTLRSYLSARSLGMTLARGQGEIFLHAVRARERLDRGPPSATTLRSVLDEHAVDGLRYLAILDEDSRVGAFAGQPSGNPLVNLPAPGNLQVIGDRMRMLAPPPPRPPPPPGFGNDFFPPPPGFEGDHPASLRAAMLVEFEPVFAQKLLRDAHANVVIGVVAALVLMGAAGVFWSMSVRADKVEAALSKQRHLAALGEMSAVLAHEIRNPLAAAKGHAQLLAEQLPEGDRPRRSADRVVTAISRLEDLTNNLLDFARSGQVDRVSTSPAALLTDAVEVVGPEFFELDLEQAPDRWSLDPMRMKQVLLNVLDNARLASPKGKVARVIAQQQGDMLVLQVHDRGDGIAPGQEDQAFEPFHTTRVRGTGLGLAIAQRIVRLHGGTIRLSNHPEGGAVVEIQLPSA